MMENYVVNATKFLFLVSPFNAQMPSIYSALYDPSWEKAPIWLESMLWFIKHPFAKGYNHIQLNQC